jgi:hypothetical protein
LFLKLACPHKAVSIDAHLSEKGHQSFFDIRFCSDVEEFGGFGDVALRQAVFIACGKKAV